MSDESEQRAQRIVDEVFGRAVGSPRRGGVSGTAAADATAALDAPVTAGPEADGHVSSPAVDAPAQRVIERSVPGHITRRAKAVVDAVFDPPPPAPPPAPAPPTERELAARRIVEEAEAAAAARRVAEEAARREAEEQARREAEEVARRAAEEQARREAEEQARREAEEAARREAEEQARRESAEAAGRAAEEQARRESEEAAGRAAEEQARRSAEERAARAAAAEEARRDAEATAYPDRDAQVSSAQAPDVEPDPEPLFPDDEPAAAGLFTGPVAPPEGAGPPAGSTPTSVREPRPEPPPDTEPGPPPAPVPLSTPDTEPGPPPAPVPLSTPDPEPGPPPAPHPGWQEPEPDEAEVAARLAADAIEHRRRRAAAPDTERDADGETMGADPSPVGRVARWVVVTLLAAVALAWLVPVTIAAVLELVALS